MNADRETIYQALFDYLQTIPGIVTFSRRVLLFHNVPPDQQPALYMEQVSETQLERRIGFPNRWRLSVMVGIYVHTGDDPDAVPATVMNPILDVFEKMFQIKGPQRVTLGGLVADAMISGDERIALGSLGPQCFAFVPLELTTP